VIEREALPPIIVFIGALRVLPGTSRNDLAELTINGVRAAWFPMLGAGSVVRVLPVASW